MTNRTGLVILFWLYGLDVATLLRDAVKGVQQHSVTDGFLRPSYNSNVALLALGVYSVAFRSLDQGLTLRYRRPSHAE